MARPLRIEFSGALYHITARGNEQQNIYRTDGDRNKFISILREIKQRYGLKIYTYVLMSNHYHLLLETADPNLSQVMHDLQTRYTIYYNRQYNRAGHLFQGRYKAVLVDKDNYLLEVTRYIHLNPVRAGLVTDPVEYQWSGSGAFYSSKRNNPLLDIGLVLNQFGKELSIARKRYREFEIAGRVIKSGYLQDKVFGQLILGTKDYVSKIKRQFTNNLDKEISLGRKLRVRKSVSEIITKVSEFYQVEQDVVLKKIGRWNEPRQVAIYLIRKYTDMKLRLISELFGDVHYTAISQLFQRMESRRQVDKKLNLEIQELENKL